VTRADPAATIVVATHDRRESLRRMLDSLLGELGQVGQVEIVVVADGCSDGTADLVREMAARLPLRLVEQPRSGPAAARNRGVREAAGDVVLFLDDDVLAQPGLLREHLTAHAGPERVAAIGPMLPPPGARLPPWLRWEAETLQKQYDAMSRGEYAPTPRQFYTANASVRRDDLLSSGGFDESLHRAEDIELAHRLADRGIGFRLLPEAAVVHIPARSFESWLKVAYEYGQAAVRFERDLGRAYLTAAYEEWPQRHPLNRVAARLCVGSGAATRLAMLIVRMAIALPDRVPATRLKLAACAAAYNIRYWQGVADALGPGTSVWRPAAAFSQP